MSKARNSSSRIVPPVQRVYYLRLCLALALLTGATVVGSLGGEGGIEMLFQTLGGGALGSGEGAPSMFALLVSCVPPLVFCYLFSDFFKEGLSPAAASVFTRTSKRSAWMGWRTFQLIGFVAAYTFLGSALSGVAALALATPAGAHVGDTVVLLASAAGLNALMLAVLLVPVNVAAIRIDVVFCFTVIMGAHFASLLICASLQPDGAAVWAPWLPAAQGVLAWHDAPLTVALSAQGVIAEFTFLHSCVYLLVLVCAEVAVASVYIKRFELY